MILRIGLQKVGPGCTPTLQPIIDESNYAGGPHIKLSIGDQVVYDDILGNIGVIGASGTAPDTNGNMIPYTFHLINETTRDIIKLEYDLANSWDSAKVELTITPYNIAGSEAEYDYHNIFMIYGYDLGNSQSEAISTNPGFDIWLYPQNVVGHAIHTINYYKPFTNQLNCYWATSYFGDNIEYVEVDGTTVISILHNIQICRDSSIVQTLICRNSTCTKTFSVGQLICMPTFEIVNTCGECTDTCTFIGDSNSVQLNVDYSHIIPRNNNDRLEYWYPYQTPSLTILDRNGLPISAYDAVQTMPSPYSTQGLPGNIGLSYILPENGSYTVRACICIDYLNGSDKIYIYEGVGTLVSKRFYMLKSYPNVTNGDFTNLVTPAATFPKGICYVTHDLSPHSWGTDKLFEVLVSDAVPGGKWYQIVSAEADCNLTAWTDGITTVNTDGAVGTMFYLPPTSHDWTPVTWGSTDLNYAISGTYHGGAITVLGPGYDCVYSCCRDLLLEGCMPFIIQRTSCNEITISNMSSDVATYSVSKLESSGFIELATGSLSPYDTTGYQEIIELVDGVYKVTMKYRDVTIGNEIVIINCAMETCAINYRKKLICCNPTTNCDDCTGSDCKEKDYYDFNAFSLLMNTYFSMLNSIYDFGYIFTDEVIVSMLSTLHTIDEYITAAGNYCIECNQPCKDCN